MKKFMILIISIFLVNLLYGSVLVLKRGPCYVKEPEKIIRYLPLLEKILFEYIDDQGREYLQVLDTDKNGNIIGDGLPILNGAKVKGDISYTFCIKNILYQNNEGVITRYYIEDGKLKYNTITNEYEFPEIKKGSSREELKQLAIYQTYYLTIKFYSQTKIEPPKNIIVSELEPNSTFFPKLMIIALSTSNDSVFYDNSLKHETGHLLMTRNNLFPTKSTDYKYIEPMKLDLSYQEGFANFFSTQNEIDGVSDFIYVWDRRIRALDRLPPSKCGDKDYECFCKYVKDVVQKRGDLFYTNNEARILSITACLMKCGYSYNRIIELFKIEDSIKKIITNIQSRYYQDFLASIGIFYLRGKYTKIEYLSDNNNKETTALASNSNTIKVYVSSTTNDDLGGLKKWPDTESQSPEPIKPKNIVVETIQIDPKHYNIFNSDTADKGKIFSDNYWFSSWEKHSMEKNSDNFIDLTLKPSSVYAVRVVAQLDYKIKDSLSPLLKKGDHFTEKSNYEAWFNNLIQSKSLFFITIPSQIKVQESEISNLHLPLIKNGPPPDDENEQPLASDGFVVYPEDEYNRFAKCYSMLPNSVSSTYCIMDVSQQISSEYMPTFYLNKELLESAKAEEQKKTIEELPDGNAAITNLKTINYPTYIANLRTTVTGQKDKQDQCVPLSAAGKDVSLLKPYINLKLKNYKFIKGNGSRGENYPGPEGTEIDLSDKYDLYAVKGNPCDLVVSLPLKRVFGEDTEAYEGKNILYLETTNGGIDTGREVYSSQSLEFIKSVKPPVNDGPVHGSRRFIHVSDAVSGFDNRHITQWIANRSSDPKTGGYVFNMAHNLLDLGPLPETSPTSKAAPAPKDESAGGGEIPESDQSPDDGYYADWTPDRGWIQEHQLSIDYASMGCYYKKIWRSVDFAVMYNPKPVLSPALICEVWRVFKKPNVDCQSGELPPNNQTISVTCKEEKSDINPTKDEPEDINNNKKDEGNPENTQPTNTTTDGSNNNNQNKKSPSPPVIDNITAVRDDSAYNHVALKIDWSDADSDINIYSARVFLINPLNPGYVRELDISRDMDSGGVTASGCTLRNIPEFKEGFFMVKAYIQDQSGFDTTKIKNLIVNLEGPVIHRPFVKDADNKTVTATISDEGTPVSDWKIDYPQDYTLVPNGRFSAIFTAYLPEQITQGESITNFNLKTTDLVGNDAKDNLYADLYGPRVGVDYQEEDKLLVSNQLDLDLNSGGIDPYRTELNIDGFIHQGDYKINLVNGEYHITYPAYKLSEGDHTAFARACDYDNNCSTSGTLQFHVAWPPEIYYFNHQTNKSSNAEYLEAKVWDKGKNLDPAGFELNIDGVVIEPTAYSYDPSSMMFYYYPAVPFTAGSHTATLTARDTTGLFDQETITFTSTGITNLILTNKNYRDIEGNGDGIINEGERIYLDLEITNTGDASTKNVWGQLINRGEYIKGVAEKNKRYGFIQPGTSAYNMEPFEFVVNDKVFEREDIDRVEAEMLLRLTDQDIWSGKTVTTDIPFTLVIERMDPMTALFELSVVKPPVQTMDPAFRLEGGWKTFGTDLRSLDIRITQDSLPPSTAHSLAAFQKDLKVVKNDAGKTFYADATLGVGDNRFVVTATADNGVVRTTEVSIKLTSQVGIALDQIADTREPNVTVTGEAWTVNSKLESVKIYLNGGFVGDAIIDGSGRFSLPVTLNGGENIIRAVALDDQGKSAEDEITVNMHGPLTISWQRKHWSTTETPILACGSYETEGDDIASIVTYVNYAPNTHETVIDRNLKTFCTTADLQPGNNILRAVGTTTGGVTAEAFSRVEYGGLSITLDPLISPTIFTTQRITGNFTLDSTEPYNIYVRVNIGGEIGSIDYIPIVDDISKTFYVDVALSGSYGNDCDGFVQTIEAYIDQGLNNAYYYGGEIQVINPICTMGIIDHDPNVCITGEGWLEGSFQINDPSYHIASITVVTTKYYPVSTVNTFTVTNWNESTGRFYLDINVGSTGRIYAVETTITDNYGNEYYHFNDHFCPSSSSNSQKENDKSHENRKSSQRSKTERRIKKTERE